MQCMWLHSCKEEGAGPKHEAVDSSASDAPARLVCMYIVQLN